MTHPCKKISMVWLGLLLWIACCLISEVAHAAGSASGHGTLIIDAEHIPLQVGIDGHIVGHVPFKGKIATGQHTVTLAGFDGRSRHQEIEVLEDETVTIKVRTSGYRCSIRLDKHEPALYGLHDSMCPDPSTELIYAVSPRFYALTRSSLVSTLRAKEFLVDLGLGYPNLVNLRALTGILEASHVGVLAAQLEVNTSAYQTDVLAGVRTAVDLGPVTIGMAILVGGGGGPRGRREGIVVFETQLALHFGSRFQVGLAMGPQWSWEQLCPSEAEVHALVRRGELRAIAALLQPESSEDICTHLGGLNPLADAAGYEIVDAKLVQKPGIYNSEDPKYSFEEKKILRPVLGLFSLVTLRMNLNAEYAINNRWNIWIRPSITIDFHPMYDARFNPLIPRDGVSISGNPETSLILHGQVGVTLKL